jgi:replicative DNA helicase
MMLNPIPPDETADEQAPARTPPHNLEAEQALLGALIVDNDAFDRVSDIVTPDHFFDPFHGRIWKQCTRMISDGRLVTPTTLKDYFEGEMISPTVSVAQYLGTLARNATSVTGAPHYARNIREMAQRRGLIVIGEDLAESAYSAGEDATAAGIIEEAESSLYRLAETTQAANEVTFADSVHRALSRAQEAYQRKGSVGLSTGIRDLDSKLGGLYPTDLIILAGRPGMGKSALAVNIAWNVAHHGHPDGDGIMRPAPVGFFSLEMSHDQLSMRVMAAEADVSSEKYRHGHATKDEMEALIRAATRIADKPLVIDDRGGVSIAQVMARARRMKRKYGIKMLIIDYLQLLSGKGKRNDNRVQELTEITTGLKALAKELEIPVIALSQLSRQVESRDDKRPMLSDLRESGSIEQDADVVMFVFREEYYVERTKPADVTSPEFADWQQRLKACQGKAEVIIGKQRHGPVGTVDVAYEGRVTRFSDIAKEQDVASWRT